MRELRGLKALNSLKRFTHTWCMSTIMRPGPRRESRLLCDSLAMNLQRVIFKPDGIGWLFGIFRAIFGGKVKRNHGNMVKCSKWRKAFSEVFLISAKFCTSLIHMGLVICKYYSFMDHGMSWSRCMFVLGTVWPLCESASWEEHGMWHSLNCPWCQIKRRAMTDPLEG